MFSCTECLCLFSFFYKKYVSVVTVFCFEKFWSLWKWVPIKFPINKVDYFKLRRGKEKPVIGASVHWRIWFFWSSFFKTICFFAQSANNLSFLSLFASQWEGRTRYKVTNDKYWMKILEDTQRLKANGSSFNYFVK